MSLLARFWKWLTVYEGWTRKKVPEKLSVYFVVDMETGNILDIGFDEIKQKEGQGVIRVYDFEKDSDTLEYTGIDWVEFPQWRKEQMKETVLKFDWGQIKGYLK